MSFASHNALSVSRNNSAVEPARRARTVQTWEQAYALPGTSLAGETSASLHVSLTVAVFQVSFSYSILFSKLTPLTLHGTPFLVFSRFWLDVSVFQHTHPWLLGGKVIGELETQEGLNGGCSCPQAEELHICNRIKTGKVPPTPESSHQGNLFLWPTPLKISDLMFVWPGSQSHLSVVLEMCFWLLYMQTRAWKDEL